MGVLSGTRSWKVRVYGPRAARVVVSLLALAASFVATLSELSSNLTYIQIQCFDKKCSQDCDGGPVPQNECIGSTGACISVHAIYRRIAPYHVGQ
jgi:hypothetical protein